MRRKSINPFRASQTRNREMLGGSQPVVESTATAMQSLAGQPSILARIYAPVAVVNFDQDDPRYDGKSTQVENIYLPARNDPPPAPRSGVAQIFNWLLKGKLQ